MSALNRGKILFIVRDEKIILLLAITIFLGFYRLRGREGSPVLYSAQYNIYSILFDRRQEAVITTPEHERTNERIVG